MVCAAGLLGLVSVTVHWRGVGLVLVLGGSAWTGARDPLSTVLTFTQSTPPQTLINSPVIQNSQDSRDEKCLVPVTFNPAFCAQS